jgi:hypothetical protein
MVLITGKILRDFEEDMALFSEAFDQFNLAVQKILSVSDADVSRAIDALEEAEKDPQQHDVLAVQTVNALRERLSTMETDARAVDFIIRIWSRVLVHADEHEELDSQAYRDVVPELIWSVQEELDVSERSTLMRLLPTLVQRIKDGLKLIGISDAESKQGLDQLVAMHAQVLRAIQANSMQKSIGLASLQQHFSTLQTVRPNTGALTRHAPTVPHIRLQAVLREFDVSAHLCPDNDVGTLLSADMNWLGGMQAGTAVEWWADNDYHPAILMWVNQPQSFYLFKLTAPGEQSRLLIYSSISLIKALREGSIGMGESAPIFDRAVASLRLNAGDLQ